MTKQAQMNTVQSLLLAAMLRNEVALTHFVGAMRGLNERPDLNRRELKQMKNRIEREFLYFENELRSVLVSYTDTDVFECMLDAAVEYNKPIRQDINAYCDAIEHILLKRQVREHRWLAQLTTAAHLVGLCAYIQGAEYETLPVLPLKKMMRLGATVVEESTYNKIADRSTPPSAMGHLSQICKQLLDMIVRKMGHDPDYEYESHDPHDPIIRSIEMHSELLIRTLQDYGVIRALFSKQDCTIEEANRIADEEDERIHKSKSKTK